MKSFAFVIATAFCVPLCGACEPASSGTHAQHKVVSEQMLFGAWYFPLDSGQELRMTLNQDHTFELMILSPVQGGERREAGGTWTLQGNVLGLAWPDGSKKAEDIISVTECELRAKVGGGVEVYSRRSSRGGS